MENQKQVAREETSKEQAERSFDALMCIFGMIEEYEKMMKAQIAERTSKGKDKE